MSWITWMAILGAWSLAGLGVAYLFGRFTHEVDAWGHADDLAPPVVSYLRHVKRKRARDPSHAAQKIRREIAGGRRSR
jgi:hypothetical protein